MRRGASSFVGIVILLALVCRAGTAQKISGAPANKKTPPNPAKKKPSSEDQRREIVFNLLEEAHAAAAELPAEQRIAILKHLCGLAFDLGDYQFPIGIYQIRSAKSLAKPERFVSKLQVKQLKAWAEELYLAADELPQGSYAKLDAQSAAVRMMAPLDIKRALEMLDGLEASDVEGAERQRNYLVASLFTEMLAQDGESVLPDLRARAQTMGENGQYPYSAMAAVLRRVQNTQMVQAIFNDAVASYQNASDKLNSMFGLLSIIRGEEVRQKLEPSQVHEASLAVANRLKAEIDREQRAYDDGKPGRPGLPLIADGIRNGLKDVDPDLAATIPTIPPAIVAPARESVGDGTPSEVVAPDLKKIRAAFDKTSTSLMEMSESEVHAGAELQQTIDRGVEQGTKLLQASTQDAKDHVAALESTMPPVTDFVQVGARTNPAMTLAAVRKVQDSEIRARMLLTVAVGLPR